MYFDSLNSEQDLDKYYEVYKKEDGFDFEILLDGPDTILIRVIGKDLPWLICDKVLDDYSTEEAFIVPFISPIICGEYLTSKYINNGVIDMIIAPMTDNNFGVMFTPIKYMDKTYINKAKEEYNKIRDIALPLDNIFIILTDKNRVLLENNKSLYVPEYSRSVIFKLLKEKVQIKLFRDYQKAIEYNEQHVGNGIVAEI